jgi:hypothetical protein
MREQVAQALAPAIETAGPVEQYLNALVRSATEALKVRFIDWFSFVCSFCESTDNC